MDRIETFERWTLRGRRFFFRAVARNGETVAQSEAYNSAAARDYGIRVAARIFTAARTVPE